MSNMCTQCQLITVPPQKTKMTVRITRILTKANFTITLLPPKSFMCNKFISKRLCAQPSLPRQFCATHKHAHKSLHQKEQMTRYRTFNLYV